MNLNHDVLNLAKEENYINGNIDDFTDCIDFTKQYQKSCEFGEESLDGENENNISYSESKDVDKSDVSLNIDERKHQKNLVNSVGEKSITLSDNCENSVKKNENDTAKSNPDGEHHPMEPDVSITVGESNLEKTINHVAKGINANKINEKPLDITHSDSSRKKFSKQKLVKKNYLKLPVNRNIKKKVSLLKLKNGKFVKKKNESFHCQGIQSNIKFKCYKCSYSDFSTISELQAHQRKCISGTLDFQSVNDPSSSLIHSSTSNLRITRKVYLCSACGSYYENWNLFLHMKEMHKRHICLYCLGMFSQPDKLAQHLQAKHNVIEQNLSSSEEFLKLYRGSCYVICVTCEGMFSEQEDFYEHSCAPLQNKDSVPCPLCGLQGTHFPTCRRSVSDRYLESDSLKSQPALGKKMSNKKKKMKANKKAKKLFKIVNNEHCEMSVVVKKQSHSDDSEVSSDFKFKENSDKSVMSPLKNSTEDLVSAKQYNEKMLQLYRPNKSSEKIISSIQSIEDSINRVVENSRIIEEKENTNDDEEEADINFERSDNNMLINEKLNFSLPVEQYPSKACTDDPAKKSNQITEMMEEQDKTLENSKKEMKNGSKNSSKNCENVLLSDSESTDSEKLTIAFDQSSEPSVNSKVKEREEDFGKGESASSRTDDNITTAPKENSYIFVSLKEECDDVKALIKEFVKISSWNCVYCSHAKRIALNGKQLALHILAEHRFVIVPENSSEEEKEESALNIIQKLKNSLSSLDNSYFNTDTFDSEDKSLWKANDRIYECFHCLFATYVHKELCSHNRKMHQKAVFLCIMCKSNFYTYSELLCHLCPGIYISGQVINPDITYRCFLCNIDPLPSSFRLMVHLRRKHNSCDICFDQSSNQFQLSTHVWKHKLSHMCYRCGIAYRNKPDITKHLFWKHGTESVLCKKCLQKKWPHVYHFCVPPNCFICDECSLSLKSAVALKVHKRIHTADYPYSCIKCEEKFISRKLLGKHLIRHDEENNKPPEEEETLINKENSQNNQPEEVTSTEVDINSSDGVEKKPEKEKKSKKKKVLNDVFDLPPVNLSESDDSDQEETEIKPKELKPEPLVDEPPLANGFLNGDMQKEEPSPSEIVDGVWNNFQNYLVAKDMPKTFRPASPFKNMSLSRIKEIMLSDHDYHINPNSSFQDSNSSKTDAEKTSSNNTKKVGLDHDYCNNTAKVKANCKSKQKIKHKEDLLKSSSSESSSDSDSSCSCGSNCSCSSGSSSSFSSNESDSDSREKRKQKKNSKDSKAVTPVDAEPPTEVDISVHDIPNENLIRESDLETDETETDEDFYDYNPAREANRILAEKRTQLLANLNGSDAITSSPSIGAEKPVSPKKKSKVKKSRSQSRTNNASKGSRKKTGVTSAAMTFAKNRSNSFIREGNGHPHVNVSSEQAHSRLSLDESIKSPSECDSKRPKRKRVPLKFYGFSSDDENEATPSSKKREKAEHNTTTPAPSMAVPATLDASEETIPTVWNPNSKSSLSWRVEKSESATPKVNPIKIKTSQSTKQTPVIQNASSYDSVQVKKFERNMQVNGNPTAQKGEKLYCFCQCPYDEVSEMIACDAEDCVIEWFHFECVGIMVPPKGSWYCPDCRKKLAAENEFLTLPTNEQNVS